jgi:hypothetical protein
MSHRVSVILEDDVWVALTRLRQGKRSRFVIRAIAKELLRNGREEVARELEGPCSRLPGLEGDAEQWVRAWPASGEPNLMTTQ